MAQAERTGNRSISIPFTPIQIRWGREENREAAEAEKKVFDEALGFYRAWHNRESDAGRAIIDFDLTIGAGDYERYSQTLTRKQGNVTKPQREYIVDSLRNLHATIASLQTPNKPSHFVDFAEEKVQGSFLYAAKLNGAKVDNGMYMATTNGGEISPTDDDILAKRSDNLLELAQKAGIPTQSPEAMLEWKRQNEIADQETVVSLFKLAAADALDQVGRFLGEHVDLQFSVLPVTKDVYFWAWSKTDSKTREFVVELNFNSPKIWTPGKIEELAYHEVAEHLRRMNEWRKRIAAGEMHPFFGATVVHGSEAAVEEGLALTLPHFSPNMYDILSPEGKFQVDSSILRQLVYGNVHLMLNSDIRPTDDRIVEYVHQSVPWEPESEIRQQIKWRTENPEYQAYLLSYAVGARLFLDVISVLPHRARRDLLQELSEKAFTPKQVQKIARELAQPRRSEQYQPRNSLIGQSFPTNPNVAH